MNLDFIVLGITLNRFRTVGGVSGQIVRQDDQTQAMINVLNKLPLVESSFATLRQSAMCTYCASKYVYTKSMILNFMQLFCFQTC